MSVSERRRPARRLLEESEQRYRSLFEHNPDAVFSLDRQPRFTSANPAAERISGYSLEELQQLDPNTLILPEHVKQTLHKFQQALAGMPSHDQIAILHKSGRRIELDITLVPMRAEDEVVGVYGIAKHITGERQAEAERADLLRREQAARCSAASAAERAAFLADASELLGGSLDYETTLASLGQLLVPQLADWYAIHIVGDGDGVRLVAGGANAPLQERVTELVRDYQDQQRGPFIASDLRTVIATGRPEFVPEITDEWLKEQGATEQQLAILHRLQLDSLIRVPLVARGHTLGAITLIYAVSGRRYTQADLKLASELARRAALAVDNARLYQEAQRAIELRDEFLAAASHDLRTPVTTIKAHAQLMQRSIARGRAGPEAGNLLAGLQSIEEAASRISAQIEQLMDISRLQSGRPLELHRAPTDLVALAQRTVAAHQELSEQHEIRMEAGQPALIGQWDGVRLERVLSNLLTNAIKYSPGGGEVVVRVGREGASQGAQAVLSVQDHGIGIPAADLPHIFERFYRARNVSGRPGTGIGLSGVRDIVQQHGGSIAVESREGEGTTFTVRLPLEPGGEE